MARGFVGRVGELDGARLHAAARQDLALQDDGAADLRGDPARVVGGAREPALAEGHPVALEERLRLVLVEPHGGPRLRGSKPRQRTSLATAGKLGCAVTAAAGRSLAGPRSRPCGAPCGTATDAAAWRWSSASTSTRTRSGRPPASRRSSSRSVP